MNKGKAVILGFGVTLVGVAGALASSLMAWTH